MSSQVTVFVLHTFAVLSATIQIPEKLGRVPLWGLMILNNHATYRPGDCGTNIKNPG